MNSDNASPKGKEANNEKDRPGVKVDDDITSLSEGLVNVSIGSKPTLDDPPEAIKSVADLISCNKYKNIVVLTGAGISCNAGIPGENQVCGILGMLYHYVLIASVHALTNRQTLEQKGRGFMTIYRSTIYHFQRLYLTCRFIGRTQNPLYSLQVSSGQG